ncbi:MAG: polymerase, sigma-24 subunit, subfamily [Actinotalea sp.]|nr:polymerase, sigma-24 subunit, subfamily [Actinotalea sp.]
MPAPGVEVVGPSSGPRAATSGDSRGAGGAVASRVDLHAAPATLPARERACVVLRHLEDLSVAETAERLGVRPGAVKKYTSTAMARLEGTLGPCPALATPA